MQNKITAAVWGPFDESIITGHSNGDLSTVEMRVSATVMTEVSQSIGFPETSIAFLSQV